MRASRITQAVNWRYALGEVALIFVGVVIALQASEWWDRRAERRSEAAYLAEIEAELVADRQRIAKGLERHRRIESMVTELLEVLRSDRPYSENLDAYFGAFYGADAFDINSAVYESLKSSDGLTLISNRTLRTQIIRVYEETISRTKRSILYEERLILDILRPFVLAHFRDLRFNASATPLDYEALSESSEFLNLVDYRLQLTKQNSIPAFEGALEQIDALIAALAAEQSG